MRALIPAYLALAALVTWPASSPGPLVPGSPSTDLWDGMWSVWFAHDALRHGQLPFQTTAINWPQGGALVVADPLGSLLAAPWVGLIGLPGAWTLLVLFQLTLSGVVAHRFAEELLAHRGRGALYPAWVAGVGYLTAPVLLAGVHNGNSESFAGGWAALAAWRSWVVATRPGWRNVLGAGVSLLLAALGSWYGAVVAFLFAGALLVLGAGGAIREGLGRRAAALGLGLTLVAPVAWGVYAAATVKGNLVGIKDAHEVALVRRTTGAADPRTFFVPGDFRSPDFREISRYGEDFVHSSYLGWVLIAAAVLGLRRGRGAGFLWLAAGLGAVLAMGPVVVMDGNAFIFADQRALPLPYFLLEGLPGFSSLSLLYRLSQATALGLVLLAALGLPRDSRRLSLVVVLLVLAENRLMSPVAGLPEVADTTVAPAIRAVAEAPEGAVMNFPVVGGRGYLYEQTIHRKPVAGMLNFPNNGASRRVWKALLEAAALPDDELRRKVASAGRSAKVRYIVVHEDPVARPDMHDTAVRALKQAWPVQSSDGTGPLPAQGIAGANLPSATVYRLW